MKKLFVLAFVALACINLNAKSPYTVTSGSAACFKSPATTVAGLSLLFALVTPTG